MANSPPRQTEKEYGRRLYVSGLNYQGQIRKPTDKAFDDMYKLPHSENKKPYMEDSYEEMEYFQSPPFGFPWDFPEFDFPFVPPSEPWTPPWLLVFHCQVESGACFCADDKLCYPLRCSHDIVWVKINDFLTPEPGNFKVSESGGEVCMEGNSDADFVVYFDVMMQADPGDGSIVYGDHQGLSMIACREEDCGCTGEETPVAYDNDSSGDTVNRNGNVTVYITAGTAPYSWSIEGTGLTLDDATTTGLSNVVNADATACGCAVITITDACGNEATGNVRVVEGSVWSGFSDYESVIWCALQYWGDSGVGMCTDVCWRLDWTMWGGWWGDCGPCRCEDYIFEHSNGHGCRKRCRPQVGARSLGECGASVSSWGCS
jgi:hypothetical protein